METDKKVRSKKLNPRIDLTAMVSVSFLLIVFFMVTKELSKPQVMSLSLPEKDPVWDGVISCYLENRILTILLDDNDKIISYQGLLAFPTESPKQMKYGKDGIRKELLNKNRQIKETTGDYKKGIIVIIKPSKKSNYGNLVAILDEMQISGISTYTIVNNFTPEEAKLLAVK